MNEKRVCQADEDAAAVPWWTLLLAVAWPAIVLVSYVRSVLLPLVLELLR